MMEDVRKLLKENAEKLWQLKLCERAEAKYQEHQTQQRKQKSHKENSDEEYRDELLSNRDSGDEDIEIDKSNIKEYERNSKSPNNQQKDSVNEPVISLRSKDAGTVVGEEIRNYEKNEAVKLDWMKLCEDAERQAEERIACKTSGRLRCQKDDGDESGDKPIITLTGREKETVKGKFVQITSENESNETVGNVTDKGSKSVTLETVVTCEKDDVAMETVGQVTDEGDESVTIETVVDCEKDDVAIEIVGKVTDDGDESVTMETVEDSIAMETDRKLWNSTAMKTFEKIEIEKMQRLKLCEMAEMNYEERKAQEFDGTLSVLNDGSYIKQERGRQESDKQDVVAMVISEEIRGSEEQRDDSVQTETTHQKISVAIKTESVQTDEPHHKMFVAMTTESVQTDELYQDSSVVMTTDSVQTETTRRKISIAMETVSVQTDEPIQEISVTMTTQSVQTDEGIQIHGKGSKSVSSHHVDSWTQTDQIFTECYSCGRFNTPESIKLSLDLKQEQGKRIALEKLVAIVENEARDLRQQLLLERTTISHIQNDIIDMKAELNHTRKVASEYKMRSEEVEESLQGARQMITKLEEQVENTNYFKSGVDYLLEAKLASARSVESQKKLETVQTELLRSQQEVNHLLDKLTEVNREKSEMVSSTVHQELLRIADERTKEAETKTKQLEYEIQQLKNQIQTSPKKTVTFAYDVKKTSSGTTNQPIKQTSPSPTKHPSPSIPRLWKEPDPLPSSFQYKFYSTDNILKSMDIREKKQATGDDNDAGIMNLPDISSLQVEQNVGIVHEEFTGSPLIATSLSDSDSDWSSSEEDDDLPKVPPMKKSVVLSGSPEAKRNITGVKKPSPLSGSPEAKRNITGVKKPPQIGPKPSLPPKPSKFNKQTDQGKSVEEKPVSFEQVMAVPTLNIKCRSVGPRGRMLPSRYRNTSKT